MMLFKTQTKNPLKLFFSSVFFVSSWNPDTVFPARNCVVFFVRLECTFWMSRLIWPPCFFAGDPVTMKMTACRLLQQSCISNLWVATPAPQRTKKVGAFSAVHYLIRNVHARVLIGWPVVLRLLLQSHPIPRETRTAPLVEAGSCAPSSASPRVSSRVMSPVGFAKNGRRSKNDKILFPPLTHLRHCGAAMPHGGRPPLHPQVWGQAVRCDEAAQHHRPGVSHAQVLRQRHARWAQKGDLQVAEGQQDRYGCLPTAFAMKCVV